MSMSSVPDTNDYQVFDKKLIIIPDYVIPSDLPKIYHYFDYYNIASLKNVEIKPNDTNNTNTSSNYIFSNDFCHAVIEVEEWHNNHSALWFYQAIENNVCKMVYDDPNYWDVEFYVKSENVAEEDYEYKNEVSNQGYKHEYEVEYEDKVEDEDGVEDEDEVEYGDEVEDEDEEVFDHSYNVEEASASSEFNSDSYSEYESGSEEDNIKDEDYDVEETDNEEDVLYEYYKMDHNKSKHFTRSNSKKENKKRKFSVDAQKEIEQLKEENDSLKAVLIKNNKNYLKNNKTKSFKNDWTRRLRQKVLY